MVKAKMAKAKNSSALGRQHVDPTSSEGLTADENLAGVMNADFVALGLGGTNMMAMLWSVAMGKRSVGVELRGDPALGIHWNIREDFYHHLGLIDRLMEERYGEARLPRRGDGSPLKLASTFYSENTEAGGFYTDEVISGFLNSFGEKPHISGLIYNTEFIDDRWQNGVPTRHITISEPKRPPNTPDPNMVGRDVATILDGPSTFQAGASEVLVLLRRYLEGIEEMDLAAGVEPRVRLFLSHRVVAGDPGENSYIKWFKREEGFVGLPDGRMHLKIEQVRELDYQGKFRRVRVPGSKVIDLGVPELFMIAQGFSSDDGDRLGFQQEDVKVDHHDGRGAVVAQADYLAGLVEVNVGGRLRRRIASEFDRDGNEYWVRQIAVGHEDDPEVGWILVQVPDFKTFDPVLAGLVPEGTDRKSREYIGAHQQLLREYYLEQVSLVTEIPVCQLEEVQMPYGPKLFSLVERIGADAQVATNGVIAGDSYGNGHFMTSGGAMTGMVGHASRVLTYWHARNSGMPPQQAIRGLADAIRQDTLGWLQVSAQEFSQAVPINFGQERIQQIEKETGRSSALRATTIDATRRHRHSLVPLNPSDWRRLLIQAGKLWTADLPPLQDTHPATRGQQTANQLVPASMRQPAAPQPVGQPVPSADFADLAPVAFPADAFPPAPVVPTQPRGPLTPPRPMPAMPGAQGPGAPMPGPVAPQPMPVAHAPAHPMPGAPVSAAAQPMPTAPPSAQPMPTAQAPVAGAPASVAPQSMPTAHAPAQSMPTAPASVAAQPMPTANASARSMPDASASVAAPQMPQAPAAPVQSSSAAQVPAASAPVTAPAPVAPAAPATQAPAPVAPAPAMSGAPVSVAAQPMPAAQAQAQPMPQPAAAAPAVSAPVTPAVAPVAPASAQGPMTPPRPMPAAPESVVPQAMPTTQLPVAPAAPMPAAPAPVASVQPMPQAPAQPAVQGPMTPPRPMPAASSPATPAPAASAPGAPAPMPLASAQQAPEQGMPTPAVQGPMTPPRPMPAAPQSTSAPQPGFAPPQWFTPQEPDAGETQRVPSAMVGGDSR
jgi:hypothetical protein